MSLAMWQPGVLTFVCSMRRKNDLLDTLVSYCKSGLESDEYRVWIVAEPLRIEEARAALKDAVPKLDQYLADSRLEIVSARDWFLKGGNFDSKRLTDSWYEKLAGVSARGYPWHQGDRRYDLVNKEGLGTLL